MNTAWRANTIEPSNASRADYKGYQTMTDKLKTSIYGHRCTVFILVCRPLGTYDVEVIKCETSPKLIGKCFRISGMSMENAE